MVVGWAAGYNTVSRMLRVWVVLHAECRSTDTNGAGAVGTTIADMSKRDDRWRAAPGRARRENVAAAPCATATTASRDSVVTATFARRRKRALLVQRASFLCGVCHVRYLLSLLWSRFHHGDPDLNSTL
eukprot:scaffold94954_cov63-Phaeocystis_antarctica.AAC.3